MLPKGATPGVRASRFRCLRIDGYFHTMELRRLLPKGLLHKAVSYARTQWPALCRYTEDGRLTIDNVSERTLRHQRGSKIAARGGTPSVHYVTNRCQWRGKVTRTSSILGDEESKFPWNIFMGGWMSSPVSGVH